MYDLIKNVIDHVWSTTQTVNSTEQQTIYFISGVVIIICFITILDLIYKVFRSVVGNIK